MITMPGPFLRGHRVTQLMHSPQYQMVSERRRASICASSRVWTMDTIFRGS